MSISIPSPEESGISLVEDLLLQISPYAATLMATNGRPVGSAQPAESA